MRSVSNEYKQAVQAPVRQFNFIVTIQPDDNHQAVILSSDDKVQKIIKTSVGGYLKATAEVVDIELLGSYENLTGRTINISLGVREPHLPDYHYCDWGNFKVASHRTSEDREKTTLRAENCIVCAGSKPHTAGMFSAPATTKDLIKQWCGRNGTTAPSDADLDGLANINLNHPQPLWDKISTATLRSIIDELAGSVGCLAKIDAKNVLVLQKPTNIPSFTLSHATMREFKFGGIFSDLNTITLARTPQEDNISESDQSIVVAPSNRNILDMALPPTWTPSASMQVTPIGRSSVRIKATLNNKPWWAANFALPVANMTSGKTYSISFGKLIGNRKKDMGVIFDCVRKSDNKRTILLEYWGADDKHGKFIYQPELYRNYRLLLFVSRGGSNVYTGNFDGTFHDIYLAEEENYSGFVEFKPNGVNEFKIANNEVLDDHRQQAVLPLLNQLKGYNTTEVRAKTSGFGFFEVGDRIAIESGQITHQAFITEVRVSIDGGIDEVIVCALPEKSQTDYSKSGGAERMLYDTSLKVDKQNQTIQSIVSQQQSLENETRQKFTEITQSLTNVTTQIQSIGGNNMIKNSVGFSRTPEGELTSWQKISGSNTSHTSPESVRFGGLSAHQINLAPSSELRQVVRIEPGKPHSLSFKAKKSLVGVGTVAIKDGNVSKTITVKENAAANWDTFALKGFITANSEIEVIVKTNSQATDFSITDLVMMAGDRDLLWQQAAGEVTNTNVVVDEGGITVKSSQYEGDYTTITPLEFAGYSTASGQKEKVFFQNRDTTKAKQLELAVQLTMSPLKIIAVKDGSRKGWSIVPAEGEN